MAAHRNYSPEQRQQVASLLAEGKLRVKDIAAQTGVSPAAVSYWKKVNTVTDKILNEGGARAKAMKQVIKRADAKPDDRVHMAMVHLREIRAEAQKRGGKQTRAELHAMLALSYLEGG